MMQAIFDVCDPDLLHRDKTSASRLIDALKDKNMAEPQINDAVHVYALANALNEQRKKGLFCDVVLKVSGQCLSAHSCVLSACSPYFQSLLVKCPPDGSTLMLKVDQPGMIGALVGLKRGGYEAMSCLLDYIYTGKLYWSEDNVSLIVELAEAVMLDGLATMGRAFLSELKPRTLNQDSNNQRTRVPGSPKHGQVPNTCDEPVLIDDKSELSDITRRNRPRKRSKLLKRHITRLKKFEQGTTTTPPTSSDEQLYYQRPERRLYLSPRLSGDKPFSCRMCLRSFKWEHSLKAHVRLHSKMSYYQCNRCGYRTIHKSSFQTHQSAAKCSTRAKATVKQTSV